VSRLALLFAVTACGDIERLSLSSQCPDPHDRMEVKLEGVPLCARAILSAPVRRVADTEETLPIGFPVMVEATLVASDGTQWWVAVGIDEQARVIRRIPVSLGLRPAFAQLSAVRPLELPPSSQTWSSQSGEVLFERYDLTTGTSKGAFDVRFETFPDALGNRGTMRVIGTFETATPIELERW
jgi:hypothetical protein